MAVNLGWAGTGFTPLHSEHVVQLYQQDAELIENVTAYAREAYRNEHAVLFIATKAHCDLFRASLERFGIDVPRDVEDGRLTFVPVEDVMPDFMRGDMPDEERFRELVERLLTAARKSGRFQHVQVFGEIVDVLWRSGNGDATLRLEQLWNELRNRHPLFTLYCGFHVEQPADTLLAGPMRDILLAHTHLNYQAATDANAVAPRGILVQLADLTRDDARQIGRTVRGLAHPGPSKALSKNRHA